jgi:ammonia channel protein AmtB
VVHLCGGSAALVAAAMLGPRSGRFDNGPEPPEPGCGTNIILGTFMLWWGWLGFNCGSTFGVQVALWKLAGKAAITTLNASMGGGCAGILVTLIVYKGKFSVSDLCNSVLGGLVAITAGCAVVSPWESIIIGFVGGFVAVMGTRLLDRCKIDDPLGAVSVHGFGGAWGMLAVGLFMREDRLSGLNNGQVGLFWSGNGYSLGIQAAAVASIVAWSMVTTTIVLGVLKLTIGIRLDEEEEHRGADATEHMIHCMDTELILARGFDKQLEVRRRSAFGLTMPVTELDDMSESSADGPAGGSGADSEAPRARRRAFSISSSTLAEIAKEQRSHTNQNGHRNVAFQVDEDDNNNIDPDGNTRL